MRLPWNDRRLFRMETSLKTSQMGAKESAEIGLELEKKLRVDIGQSSVDGPNLSKINKFDKSE